MSYARVTEQFSAWEQSSYGAACRVPVGSEVKNIVLCDGDYAFECRTADVGAWMKLATNADLPAHTDRGSIQRAARRPATLRPGRPSFGELKPLGVKLSKLQRSWVNDKAKRENMKASEFVRRVLTEQGMPPQ